MIPPLIVDEDVACNKLLLLLLRHSASAAAAARDRSWDPAARRIVFRMRDQRETEKEKEE